MYKKIIHKFRIIHFEMNEAFNSMFRIKVITFVKNEFSLLTGDRIFT